MGNTCTTRVHTFPVQSKTHRHLVVEGNAFDQIRLVQYLASLGVLTDVASTAKECLQCMRDHGEYCIIWMSLRLDCTMSGLECTRVIRSHNYKGVIIGVTDYHQLSMLDVGLQSGMNELLSKPIHQPFVLSCVSRYCPSSSPCCDRLSFTSTQSGSSL